MSEEEKDDVSLRYHKFIGSVNETNKVLLQPVPRKLRSVMSKDKRNIAQWKMHAAKEVYHQNPLEESKEEAKEAKRSWERNTEGLKADRQSGKSSGEK